MKKYVLIFSLLAFITLVFGFFDLHAFVQTEQGQSAYFGTWVSLLPPVVAIALALITREVILSLFAGIWIGALFVADLNPFTGTAEALDLITIALVDADHIAIILFSLLLGGMVGVMSRGGGTLGVVDLMQNFANNRTKGQFFGWLSAFFIFFDDYANTLIRGNALRPMTDRLLISREKLSYIVDSTAAPLAVCAIITTWIGFEISQIQSSLTILAGQTENPELAAQLQAGADNVFTIFLDSLPYLFYPFLALAFVIMIILMKRDFGPMLEAERRAASGGGVIREGSMPAADTSLDALQPPSDKPRKWYNAALPVLSVIVVALIGLYVTGSSGLDPAERGIRSIIGEADPFASLLWASFTGCGVAILLVVAQGILSVKESLEAWVAGLQSMLMAIIILALAWGLGEATQVVGTGTFLASLLEDSLPLVLLPGLVFFIAAATAFATGTSWGTMAILFPVVVPLAVALGAGVGFAGGEHYAILLGSISSVMAGAVFGDHCSPISDTTVLSAMSSACDLVDHVRTQLPYALLVAFVALVVGEIPAALEWMHPAWGILIGIVILYLVLRFFGENPDPPSGREKVAAETGTA